MIRRYLFCKRQRNMSHCPPEVDLDTRIEEILTIDH